MLAMVFIITIMFLQRCRDALCAAERRGDVLCYVPRRYRVEFSRDYADAAFVRRSAEVVPCSGRKRQRECAAPRYRDIRLRAGARATALLPALFEAMP